MRPENILVLLLLFFIKSAAQEFNPKLDKDSLFQVVIKYVPEEKKTEFTEIYKTGNNETKEFLLFMWSMPRSSKAEMIANLERIRIKLMC